MVSVREVDNKQVWEKFIIKYEKASNKPLGGVFLQSWAWGSFQKNLNRKVYRLGVYEDKNLVGVSLLYLQKAKSATFLYLPAGPVFPNWTKKYFDRWLDFVKEIAKEENASFFRVEPRVSSDEVRKLLKQSGFVIASAQTQPKCTAVFDLTKDEEYLLETASDSTRYNIRASQRKGVSIREGKEEDIKIFLKLLQETAQRKSLDLPIEKDYHKIQYETLRKEGLMKLFIAQAEGEALGAALVVFYGESAYYLHAANSLNRKQLRASYPLVWYAVMESKKRAIKWFDFWGIADSDDPKEPWAGVTSFKLSFGSSRVCFDPVYDLPFKSSYLFTKAVETWRKPIKKIIRFGM